MREQWERLIAYRAGGQTAALDCHRWANLAPESIDGTSIQRRVLRHLRQQSILPPFLPQDRLPELAGIGVENQLYGSRMFEPGPALHLRFELARRPAGVTREDLDFSRGPKASADFEQAVQ